METINWPALVLGGMMVGLAFVASTLLGLAAAAYFLLRLPADYFLHDAVRKPQDNRQWPGGIARRALKNILGAGLVVAGGMLSLPGIPGPGLVMLLFGLTLVDLPGKRRFVGWLLGRPAVLGSINRLRQRHGKPPLLLTQSGCAK